MDNYCQAKGWQIMAVFRYAAQEAVNIRKAAAESRRNGALDAAQARKRVEQDIAVLTKSDVGLGNVDNTSDANKPVSSAQQTALNGKLNTWVSVPATAASTGTAGQLAYDASWLYVCTAANTWRRTALAIW